MIEGVEQLMPFPEGGSHIFMLKTLPKATPDIGPTFQHTSRSVAAITKHNIPYWRLQGMH
jgi:hypothetical protein